MHYNYCRIHKVLRVTPAMAVGVTDKLWTIADMVAVLEAGKGRIVHRLGFWAEGPNRS
jgi:hypothetical protein